MFATYLLMYVWECSTGLNVSLICGVRRAENIADSDAERGIGHKHNFDDISLYSGQQLPKIFFTLSKTWAKVLSPLWFVLLEITEWLSTIKYFLIIILELEKLLGN